jgi:hypothetical protein
MTYTATITPVDTLSNQRTGANGETVDAVVFDPLGIPLDESCARPGLLHLATFIEEWLGIDSAATIRGFIPSLRVVAAAFVGQPVYKMHDLVFAALEHLIASHGHTATRGEITYLEQELWAASTPTTVAADGTVEMLAMLRDAGIRVGPR